MIPFLPPSFRPIDAPKPVSVRLSAVLDYSFKTPLSFVEEVLTVLQGSRCAREAYTRQAAYLRVPKPDYSYLCLDIATKNDASCIQAPGIASEDFVQLPVCLGSGDQALPTNHAHHL